jgi:hypothetical protein
MSFHNPSNSVAVPAMRRRETHSRLDQDCAATGRPGHLDHPLACAEPDCPPRETVILVMWPEAPAWKLRVHKAMLDVAEEDMALALQSAERISCS